MLLPETNRCVLCLRRCGECGGPIRFRGEKMCRPPSRSARAAAVACPRCGKPGYLRCDRLVWLVLPARPGEGSAAHMPSCRRVAPPRGPRHVLAMLAAPPGRPFVHGETLATRLDEPPAWLDDFVAYLAAHCPARAAC